MMHLRMWSGGQRSGAGRRANPQPQLLRGETRKPGERPVGDRVQRVQNTVGAAASSRRRRLRRRPGQPADVLSKINPHLYIENKVPPRQGQNQNQSGEPSPTGGGAGPRSSSPASVGLLQPPPPSALLPIPSSPCWDAPSCFPAAGLRPSRGPLGPASGPREGLARALWCWCGRGPAWSSREASLRLFDAVFFLRVFS